MPIAGSVMLMGEILLILAFLCEGLKDWPLLKHFFLSSIIQECQMVPPVPCHHFRNLKYLIKRQKISIDTSYPKMA